MSQASFRPVSITERQLFFNQAPVAAPVTSFNASPTELISISCTPDKIYRKIWLTCFDAGLADAQNIFEWRFYLEEYEFVESRIPWWWLKQAGGFAQCAAFGLKTDGSQWITGMWTIGGYLDPVGVNGYGALPENMQADEGDFVRTLRVNGGLDQTGPTYPLKLAMRCDRIALMLRYCAQAHNFFYTGQMQSSSDPY